jgi:hypothetical protein
VLLSDSDFGSTLCQMNLVNSLISYVFRIRFNIILKSTSQSSEQFLPFRFSTKILYPFLTGSMRTTFPAKLILLHFMTVTMGPFVEENEL